MVPENSLPAEVTSVLDTFQNVIDKFVQISLDKQTMILESRWDRLNQLTDTQNELKSHLDNTEGNLLKLLSYIEKSNLAKDERIINKKKRIRTAIEEYKENEKINIKMLDDYMYATKLKIETIYSKNTKKNETYSKELRKNCDLFNRDPLIFDKLI